MAQQAVKQCGNFIKWPGWKKEVTRVSLKGDIFPPGFLAFVVPGWSPPHASDCGLGLHHWSWPWGEPIWIEISKTVSQMHFRLYVFPQQKADRREDLSDVIN